MNSLRKVAFTLSLATLAAGCGGKPLLVDDQTEVKVGRQTAANIEAKYGLVSDPAATARITRIGQRLVAKTDRRNLPWSFKILNTSEINALAAPGGFIYVTQGLL